MANVKVSLMLPVEVVEKVTQMANTQGLSRTEVIRQAIAREYFFDEEIRKGSDVLVEYPDGRLFKLVWPQIPA